MTSNNIRILGSVALLSACLFAPACAPDAEDAQADGEDVVDVDPDVLASEAEAYYAAHQAELKANAKPLLRRDSSASVQKSVYPTETAPLSGYDLTVRTGAVKDGGTDADVYITLFGKRTVQKNGTTTFTTQMYYIDNPNKNDFEAGNIDKFYTTDDLKDKINMVKLEHTNSGKKPGWYVQDVAVGDDARGVTTTCNFQVWLANDEAPLRRTYETRPCY